MSKKIFLKGTLILACTGLISRIAGFFYRIFLSHAIGAEGLGLYQLVLPLQGLMAALSYTGIQSALSRLIASRLALQEKKEARFSLVTGTLMAVFFSAAAGFLLFQHAYFFASAILKTPQTAGLLRITAVSIPLCAIHSCIDSYYYARKKASVPAVVQLSEQSARIGTTYILYLIFLSEGRPITALIAAGGSLAGETAASLVSLLVVSFHFGNHPVHEKTPVRIFPLIKDLFTLSFPISLNRILLTLLGSIEAVLIPQMLLRSGMTASDSLKIYGIFTGMALPLLLFPSTLTSSAAVMLMPSIAQLDALGKQKQIRPCHRSDLFSVHVPGISMRKRILSFWPIPRNIAFSQPDCRNLHTVSVFYLSFSLYKHHAHQHPAGTWKTGALSDPQYCRHSHPYFLRCFYNSGNGDPRLFLRNFSG